MSDYTPTIWGSGPCCGVGPDAGEPDTPITKGRLQNMESGIDNAHVEIDGIATALGGAGSTTGVDANGKILSSTWSTTQHRKWWARDPEQMWVGVITRDSNGAALSASVVWPDGSAGAYSSVVLSSAWPGAVDSYQVTHTVSGKTYTQPTVSRSAAGDITTQPAIVES